MPILNQGKLALPSLKSFKWEPMDLFNRFYSVFGFVVTIALYIACFRSLAATYFDDLFIMTALTVPAWGLLYGGWVNRQLWTWCLLTLISIGSLIALGFHLTGRPEMFFAFGSAQATCVFWLALTGFKLGNYSNQ